ncbi:MAG: NTP transferase domain-containing protein [Bacilli bacterium]|nr:NTP transferase domain-containing protein [Bacilli bacterium]
MEKYTVVLAAGKGSRMKSRDPEHSKVSYPILDKPLINYVVDAVKPIGPKQIVVVVGFGGEITKQLVEKDADVVWQKVINGTGGAVLTAKPLLEGKEGFTLVVYGDTPLITTETINNVFHIHERTGNKLTIVSMVLENPRGYGRIIREPKSNHVIAVREDRDCDEYERDINEVNSGMYVFDNQLLFQYLDKITPNNAQGEYYLTDLVDMFVKDGHKVGAYVVEDAVEMFGINDRVQLAYAAKIMRKRINHKLMLSGVSIEDPDSTYIAPDAEIGRDTIIQPNVSILGHSKIGENNMIGSNTYMNHVNIGNDNVIKCSWLEHVQIGNGEHLFNVKKEKEKC